MRYALLIYSPGVAAPSDPEMGRGEDRFIGMIAGLRARGVLASGQRLLPARAARVVRCWDGGDIIITEGPAAQGTEQLTGWVTVECEDLDAAVRLATSIPAAWSGSVEIRPAG